MFEHFMKSWHIRQYDNIVVHSLLKWSSLFLIAISSQTSEGKQMEERKNKRQFQHHRLNFRKPSPEGFDRLPDPLVAAEDVGRPGLCRSAHGRRRASR